MIAVIPSQSAAKRTGIRLFFACFFMVTGTLLVAQTLSPVVIATGGTSLTGSSASTEFTIGEVATATLVAGTDALTQGFHQPNITVVSTEEMVAGFAISVYPNPTEDFATIASSSQDPLQVHIYDARGQHVMDSEVFVSKLNLDVHSIANGAYLFQVSRPNGEPLKNFSIIKRSTR